MKAIYHRITALTCLFLFVFSPTIASAFEGENLRGGKLLDKAREELQLTKAQKQEIAGVLLKYRAELKALRGQAIDYRTALAEAIEADGSNSPQVGELAEDMGEMHVERVTLFAQIYSEILPILDVAQIAKVRKLRAAFLKVSGQ